MKEIETDGTECETDTQMDKLPEQAETQYSNSPDTAFYGSETPLTTNPPEASQGDDSLSYASEGEGREAGADLARMEESFARGLAEILKAFQDKLAFDQFKEDQITRLHDELQWYKSDLVAKACRPLVSGIIRLHDDIGKIINALRKRDPAELSSEKFFKVIDGFQQDIELILAQNGIEAYREIGETFDPRRQKAMMTIPTADAVSVGLIAERLRPGFEQGGFIFQKEGVAVYAAATAIAAPTGSERNVPASVAPAIAKEGEAK